jgi:hypothetical protein
MPPQLPLELRPLPRYIPLEIEPDIKASLSDLLDFHWEVNAVRATFIIPENPNAALEVAFAGSCIVRLADEMPLSTEEDDSPNEGLVPNHFAYRVEGALFFRVQSETFKAVHPACAHYRFITGWTCLDVITGAEPRFKVVERDLLAIAENARVGLPVYRRKSGRGRRLFFDRQQNCEELIGEVVLAGTWFDNESVPHRAAIIKVLSEFSSKRCKEDADGDLAIDPSIPPPLTKDGYVYQFLPQFEGPEYESLDEAMWWAQNAPKGPITWDR